MQIRVYILKEKKANGAVSSATCHTATCVCVTCSQRGSYAESMDQIKYRERGLLFEVYDISNQLALS